MVESNVSSLGGYFVSLVRGGAHTDEMDLNGAE